MNLRLTRILSLLVFATLIVVIKPEAGSLPSDCQYYRLHGYHDFQRYTSSTVYRKIDTSSHEVTYKCSKCDATSTKIENHNWGFERTLRKVDENYHELLYKCYFCDATKTELDRHGEYHSYSKVSCQNNNETTHNVYYECAGYSSACDAYVFLKQENHKWSFARILQKATPKKKGILLYECEKCDATYTEKVKWKYGSDYSQCYDIMDYSWVFKDSKSMWVRLKNPLKGAVLKVKIGSKTFTKKIKNNKRKVDIRIKPQPYGKKIRVGLYYKGKIVGKEDEDIDTWHEVRYASRISIGMTKKQVRCTWGYPKDTSSSSGGYSYWYYDDGSSITFKNGYVSSWYAS